MVFINFQTKFKSMRFDVRIDSKYHSIFSFPPYATVFWILHQIIIYSGVIHSQPFTDFHVTNFSPRQYFSAIYIALLCSPLNILPVALFRASSICHFADWALGSRLGSSHPLPFPLPFSSFLLPPYPLCLFCLISLFRLRSLGIGNNSYGRIWRNEAARAEPDANVEMRWSGLLDTQWTRRTEWIELDNLIGEGGDVGDLLEAESNDIWHHSEEDKNWNTRTQKSR